MTKPNAPMGLGGWRVSQSATRGRWFPWMATRLLEFEAPPHDAPKGLGGWWRVSQRRRADADTIRIAANDTTVLSIIRPERGTERDTRKDF